MRLWQLQIAVVLLGVLVLLGAHWLSREAARRSAASAAREDCEMMAPIADPSDGYCAQLMRKLSQHQ